MCTHTNTHTHTHTHPHTHTHTQGRNERDARNAAACRTREARDRHRRCSLSLSLPRVLSFSLSLAVRDRHCRLGARQDPCDTPPCSARAHTHTHTHTHAGYLLDKSAGVFYADKEVLTLLALLVQMYKILTDGCTRGRYRCIWQQLPALSLCSRAFWERCTSRKRTKITL